MRKEIAHWWEQAQEELAAARYNRSGGKLFVAAFLCHQATEVLEWVRTALTP